MVVGSQLRGQGSNPRKVKLSNDIWLIQPKPTPVDHLGIALHESGQLTQDCREKRAQFIDKSAKIRETFKFAHPTEQIFAVEKYCSSAIHGGNLWDLTSKEAQMMFGIWRTGHKLSWQVDRKCHTYLVQEALTPGLM